MRGSGRLGTQGGGLMKKIHYHCNAKKKSSEWILEGVVSCGRDSNKSHYGLFATGNLRKVTCLNCLKALREHGVIE